MVKTKILNLLLVQCLTQIMLLVLKQDKVQQSCVVKFEGAPVVVKSGMQIILSLSVTEMEVIALVIFVQEILYLKKLL